MSAYAPSGLGGQPATLAGSEELIELGIRNEELGVILCCALCSSCASGFDKAETQLWA